MERTVLRFTPWGIQCQGVVWEWFRAAPEQVQAGPVEAFIYISFIFRVVKHRNSPP